MRDLIFEEIRKVNDYIRKNSAASTSWEKDIKELAGIIPSLRNWMMQLIS